MFVLWDSSLLNEDFAYYMGGILVNHSDLLFCKTKAWYLLLRSDFEQFMMSGLYDQIKSVDANIFKKFFEESVKTGKSIISKVYGEIKITVGYYKDILKRIIENAWDSAISSIIGKLLPTGNNKSYTLYRGFFGVLQEKISGEFGAVFIKKTESIIYDSSHMYMDLSNSFYINYPEPTAPAVAPVITYAIIYAILMAVAAAEASIAIGGLVI